MIKKLILSVLLVCELSILFAGSPVMVIRCRQNAAQLIFGEPCDMPGFITYEGHCFPLPVDGECPSVPGFEYLVPMDVIIDNTTVTICVPDCSEITGCEASCIGPIVWQAALQACGCEVSDNTATGSSAVPEATAFCGCPDPLIVNPSLPIVDGTGSCVVPERECFDLGLNVVVEPFICDQPTIADDTITIVIKPAAGSRPGDVFAADDALTIEDLENCNLIDDTGELLDLIGIFGEGDRGAFLPDASGCIVIEFTRDPSLPTTISFLSNDPIIIPECPRSFDPCSCRPENIADADGVVQYWYDELTFIGNPSTSVSVQSTNGPGFLDASLVPITGLIGTTDATGLLSVPFYRTPGELTDVTLVDGNGNTTTLMSGCNLNVNACANIIPTMGEWGMIILGLLLIICSIVAFSSRTTTVLSKSRD